MLVNPKTDIFDPKVANIRRDSEEPSWKKSITDMEEPRIAMLRTDRDELSVIKLKIDIVTSCDPKAI